MTVPNERFDYPALFSGGYCQAGGSGEEGNGSGSSGADNSGSSGGYTGNDAGDGTDDAADSNSAGGRDFSKFWPLALIFAFGILFFCFSKDMLSSVFKKNEKKANRSRKAKAMKLFMKYSD